ncbi:S-adenosyl-L-methionine-dependent methyltransferase [Fimicolochytrium jonesii]|uniref:S-adenosyl-L-methionine-dependent methyltransferase n=1 Tax=Fimicolochytrium jonesii TaxID=1396493 RepID=UPI0022FE09CA|nr:S-adenosyl-L-methionine-dependent methyltransferase [Fimicolochytrium jonesii]KAI8820876.1 S-adenosyl-L-methionine-dependent methyltransferase [Fimicolochytrium jonesii]
MTAAKKASSRKSSSSVAKAAGGEGRGAESAPPAVASDSTFPDELEALLQAFVRSSTLPQKQHSRLLAVLKSFSTYFLATYPQDRWISLLAALRQPTRYACLVNRHADPLDVVKALQQQSHQQRQQNKKAEASENTYTEDSPAVQSQLEYTPVPWLRSCRLFVLPEAKPEPGVRTPSVVRPFPPPGRDIRNTATHYLLDLASALPVEALDIRPGDKVLDICAAPGGKSLCILQSLSGPKAGDDGKPLKRGVLHANEISNERRKRLRNVLQSYVPDGFAEATKDANGAAFIQLTGVDGTSGSSDGAFEAGSYDKVLLDAPCSGERHLLHDEEEMLSWTPARTKANSKRQMALLREAVRCVKMGGMVVYATCSLSQEENDGVVAKVLAKLEKERGKASGKAVDTEDDFDDDAFVMEVVKRKKSKAWPVGEKTKHGWMILPDRDGGWGPIYFSVLKKSPMDQLAI